MTQKTLSLPRGNGKKIYIAGPMRGYDNFNFDAFDRAVGQLRRIGWIPISPCDMDRLYEGWTWYPPEDLEISPELKRRVINRDLQTLLWECDAIYILSGWETSKGTIVELSLAEFLGLEIYYED